MAIDLSAYEDSTITLVDNNVSLPSEYDTVSSWNSGELRGIYDNETKVLDLYYNYTGSETGIKYLKIYDNSGNELRGISLTVDNTSPGANHYQLNNFDTEGTYNFYVVTGDIGTDEAQWTTSQLDVTLPKPTFIETFWGVIGSITTGFTGLFALLFSSEGIINVFYTPATETVSGSLTMIGVLSLLTFGFGLVNFAFRKILKLLKMRS